MSHWYIPFILLTLLGVLVFLFELFAHGKDTKAAARFNQILKYQQEDSNKSALPIQRWINPNFLQDSEFGRLLLQAGWDTKYARMLFWFMGRIAPVITAMFLFIFLITTGENVIDAFSKAVFTFACMFVGSNMILRWRAKLVAKAIVKELIPFLHMLRMLFNSGLSLEHSLIILVEQSGNLFPHLAQQLQRVSINLHAGQDQADALVHMAQLLDIKEVTDAVSILFQVSRYGGNIQASLSNYIELIETRQFSSLREYVSKLSAKMSIVMIVFMFPALIIFIAGPGVIGIADALRGSFH